MAIGDEDLEVQAAVEALFKLASSAGLTKRVGEPSLDIRARATLALALFMPNSEVRRNLAALIASPETPEQIRSVASEAVSNWPTS